MGSTDWAAARGIADEPNFDDFILSTGGTRVDSLVQKPPFQNADYFFSKQRVVIELKILETEFGSTPQFNSKLSALMKKHVRENGLRGPFLGQALPRDIALDMLELFRSPLARVMRKANRQIKETKEHLGTPEAV